MGGSLVYFLSIFFGTNVACSAISPQVNSVNRAIVEDEPSAEQVTEFMHFSVDYVRCFCNLPACVSTGYMCKSSNGGCFSDLLGHAVVPGSPFYRGRHGCLELLNEKEQEYCLEAKSRKKHHQKSLFLCCSHDMCNHVDSPQTKGLLNSTTLLNDPSSKLPWNSSSSNNSQQHLYSNSEVWFRAATIAVPICGAVILFVLIALAVKILRNEHQTSPHKVGPTFYMNKSTPASTKHGEHLEGLLRPQACYINNLS